MGKFIDHHIARAKAEGFKMLKVSKEYGRGGNKEILSKSEYTSVGYKKKERCKYAQKAIVADGPGIGNFLLACVSEDCPKHRDQGITQYSLTPKEKEKRKVERKKEKVIKDKKEERIVEVMESIKWPLNKKTLNVMFGLVIRGQGVTVLRPVAKRLGIEPKKVTKYGSTYYDWEDPIWKAEKTMSDTEKLRLVIGVMLERAMWGDGVNKIFKALIEAGKK